MYMEKVSSLIMRGIGTTYGGGRERSVDLLSTSTDLHYVSVRVSESAQVLVHSIQVMSYILCPFSQTLAYHIPAVAERENMIYRPHNASYWYFHYR